MLDPINMRDFDDFLKQNHRKKVHFILPGAVVSGTYDDHTPETIYLENAITYAGTQTIKTEVLIVPRERILAWGAGTIKSTSSGL